MTPEQYERWKDFALRTARTCFKRRRAPSPKEIVYPEFHPIHQSPR